MLDSIPGGARTAGVDAGASLCKVVLADGPSLRKAVFPAADLDAARARVEGWRPHRVAATGGGAPRLGERIGGVRLEIVPEFEAWARGAPILAHACGVDLPTGYLLVSLGTGTSVLAVGRGQPQRVGGSALGGGTLLGLGRLLLGVESFDDLAALAATGDRRPVDLLVGDIYRGVDTPLPRELNAASFGKLDSRRPQDLAAALMGLVGENVALICGAIARGGEESLVVYCGSTLNRNPTLRRILDRVTSMSGVPARFLDEGAFCGAVGAAALAGATGAAEA